MKRRMLVASLVLMACAGSGAWLVSAAPKLPKCSNFVCRDTGCPADVLCVSGAHVKTCAEWCGGK